MFKLRDYQQECVDTILSEFETKQSQIVQLPTGAGKTVILWHVIKAMVNHALVIAPTKELVEQITETGQLIMGDNDVKQKDRHWHKTCDYIVSTAKSAVMARPHGTIDYLPKELLVVDEAHRSRSKSLETLIQWWIHKGGKVLGLTATPERMDGKSLLDIYEDLTYKCTLLDLIKQRYLVDLECYRIRTYEKIP